MKQTLAIIAGAAVVVAAVLAVVAVGVGWPAVENPPRQGEALDPAALQSGRIVHSNEAIARLIREPENAWSNFAFVAVGALLLTRNLSRSARLVGVALIAVGIASFLYHASASRTLRHFDVAAMYGLFFGTTVFAIGLTASRVRRLAEDHVRILGVAAIAFAAGAAWFRNTVILGLKPLALTTITAVAAAILISGLAFAALRRRCVRLTARTSLAIALFGAAVVCQIGDRPGGWLCSPGSLIQAHALWHLLSALALLIAIDAVERTLFEPAPIFTARAIAARASSVSGTAPKTETPAGGGA